MVMAVFNAFKFILKGKEVAIYVEKHFIEELRKNENFKKEKMELALEETFLKMDILLNTNEAKKELQ